MGSGAAWGAMLMVSCGLDGYGTGSRICLKAALLAAGRIRHLRDMARQEISRVYEVWVPVSRPIPLRVLFQCIFFLRG